MTFGRFHFRVEEEGSYRLDVPTSSGLSVVDSDFSDSSSAFETSDEETSPPRFIKTTTSEKLVKVFGDMSFESSADSNISSDSDNIDNFSFIDISTIVGEVFADLYDGVTNPDKDQHPKYHQIYAIEETSRPQEETSENFDNTGNPYVDPADLTRGLRTKYVGPGTREMVQFPQAVWDKVARAIDGELLGFLVSARGIEANLEKIQAIVTMRKPTKLKEMQQLTGRVAALSRFVAWLGEKALPFYALIKQGEKFQWNEEADRAFEDLKRTISTPPFLVAPKEKEPLLLYIAATPQLVSTVLVVEREEEGKLHGVQRPVYFVSEVLSPSKQRYPQYQKLAYGVFTTARKLRHYFWRIR
ncbi:hypothetical protein QYE76_002935 [Lolium multiflorum]|uniref:Reverse transcriptase/retrotransposon-derived protein RNase H-like domain-containing protein n=1 Tax=Lolium multiflorum TaxID=4521 RepID=A0AAD8VYD5_LOLMU|nr:hypothetical protein QYE76_002935 [Lolium multiflorum]